MTSVRFIHTSDWQLGMTRARLSDDALPRFSQARIDAIKTMGRLASEHGAKFIVVSGDVFESNQLSRDTLLRTIDALKGLTVPVFLLPGNHDPYDGGSIFRTREFEEAPEHIIILDDTSPRPVPGLDGVEVVGAPWPAKRLNTDICAQMADSLDPATTSLRIGVAHGQVDELSPDTSLPGIIALSDAENAILERRLHYLALGDRHSVTKLGNTDRIWYSGAPVATAFTENDPNKALLVELSEAACEVTPIAVGNWAFIQKQFEMNGEADLKRFKDWLNDHDNKECTLIKVGFTGSINLATAAELERFMLDRAHVFASLKQRDRTTDLAIVPDQLDEDSVSLSGYARETWNALLKDAEQGDQEAQDALLLLYRLSEEGAG